MRDRSGVGALLSGVVADVDGLSSIDGMIALSLSAVDALVDDFCHIRPVL